MEKQTLAQLRRRSREIALQLLYTLDLRPQETPESVLARRLARDIDLADVGGHGEEIEAYAAMLVRGVWENRMSIDSLIRSHVTGWRPERMVAVDRAAVRLALFEGVLGKKAPLAVVISEAVDLAKLFGTDESGRFVNGVLGRIVRALENGGEDEGSGTEDADCS